MKRLLIYIAKCVTGVLIAFSLANLLHYNAIPQASNRIKANLIGAAAGMTMLLFHAAPGFTVSGAVIITIIVCFFTKLETTTRTALAATIIVTIHENGKYIWDTALERVIAVVAGCLIGIIITLIFHSRFISSSIEPGLKTNES